LANIKSQIKRNRQNEKRRLRNRGFRGAARAAVNRARAAFEAGAPDTKEAVMRAVSMLDKAAEKGVIHPNNAARRKGRLMKRLFALGGQKIEAPAVVEAAEEAPAAETATKPAAKKAAPAKKESAAKKTAEKKPAEKKTATAKKTAAKK